MTTLPSSWRLAKIAAALERRTGVARRRPYRLWRGRRMGQEVIGPGRAGQAEEDEEGHGENPSKPEMYRHTLAPVRRRRRARLLALLPV